ncbi:sigma-70 family RNA polymerase sigma factor [Intrasporangium sp.]|uniref:sigma-70 family RNA polymerase sigma factor n=1 Tax=Intrasporangium sp. TaxID=1925024 RepID=UPI0033657FE8
MVALTARLPASPDRDPRASALRVLFDAHYGRLVRTARLLVDDRETAEDVVMDAFMSLDRRWSSLRRPEDADRYLMARVLNGARRHLRRKGARLTHVTPSHRDTDGPANPTHQGSTRAAVMRSLRALPARQQQVLILSFCLDLSERQVAEQLGIGIGSVRQLTSGGLASLARNLEVQR